MQLESFVMGQFRKAILFFFAVVCALGGKLASQSLSVPTTTSDRVLNRGWWPTKGTEPREQYVGSVTCAGCHSQIAETQKTTAMAHASAPASWDAFAKPSSDTPLSARVGPYSYEIAKTKTGVSYSVTQESRSVTTSLGWVFGSGHFGQTYVYEQNGTIYESHLSYYPGIQALDFTTGHNIAPAGLDKALGTPQPPDIIRGCFGCHTTASTTSGRFEPSRFVPGVTCEACHGPGAQHVAAMTLGKGEQTPTLIMNPAALAPPDSVDFCGACHRTRLDVQEMGIIGVATVRFPAYRLQASRCWGSDGDPRMTCIACHDPHRPLVTDAASYDKNCLSCHQTSATSKPAKDHPGAACPVAQKECVSCHMPKYEIHEMHANFTDHKIAIHHPGEPFTE